MTMPTCSNSGIRSNPSTPSTVVATPMRRARARPSDAGSMPTMAATVRGPPARLILIIRSVPMLPEPMIATWCGMSAFLRECRGHDAERADLGLDPVAVDDRYHGSERAGEHDVAAAQRRSQRDRGARQPIQGV